MSQGATEEVCFIAYREGNVPGRMFRKRFGGGEAVGGNQKEGCDIPRGGVITSCR